MRSVFAIIPMAMLLFSCKKEMVEPSEAVTPAKEEKQFEMYEMSEMSLLMEQLFLDNQNLKARIAKGEDFGVFPEHFLKIHSAKMTDESENDEFFKANAQEFIKAQQLIYSDVANAKGNFNKMVDACISCHKVKCGGPISRIKKLYIK